MPADNPTTNLRDDGLPGEPPAAALPADDDPDVAEGMRRLAELRAAEGEVSEGRF